MTPKEALIALNMLPGIGPVRVRRLMDHFGDAGDVLKQTVSRLMEVRGIGSETARMIGGWESHIDLVQELEDVADRGLSVVSQADEAYPESLRQSYDPPLVLYVWGELKESDRHALAIVGSRKTTHYGIQTSRQFAFQLASSGLTVVSGLARGIDTHAHEGAIAANGRTIAVIGSGLGQVYPPENMALAEKIADGHGAVVSEFPLNMAPGKKTFPMRNRVVAAWSQAVIVVECPEWSGARITANLAGELGKPVFAVPGPIDRPSSAGCHTLIREGATLVTSGQDVLDDLSMLPLGESPESRKDDVGGEGEVSGSGKLGQLGQSGRPGLKGVERLVFDALGKDVMRMDEILTATPLSMPEVNSTLLKLEIQGLVQQLPGGRFSRKSCILGGL